MKITDFSFSAISAGFVAVLVGFASSVAIIFQAAQAAGANQEMMASWILALGLGMGLTCIIFSWYYKAPILTAWSTPGAALLATSLQGVSLAEAIGAFLFASLLTVLLGLSGWFEKLMKLVPASIASAMLAGVLLPFGFEVFISMQSAPYLVSVMLVTFIICRRLAPRYAVIWMLIAGAIFSYKQLSATDLTLELSLASGIWVWPEWDLGVVLGVGLPLFVVTMTSQNIPGVAILKANGYHNIPTSPLITGTGLASMLLAPLGGFAFNLAAITAAICAGPEAHPQKAKRYTASIAAGIFYLLTGLAGVGVISLFSLFPKEMISTLAGLALLGVISQSLSTAFEQPPQREAAAITLLVTLSGVAFLGLAAAFWGLVAGLILLRVTTKHGN